MTGVRTAGVAVVLLLIPYAVFCYDVLHTQETVAAICIISFISACMLLVAVPFVGLLLYSQRRARWQESEIDRIMHGPTFGRNVNLAPEPKHQDSAPNTSLAKQPPEV